MNTLIQNVELVNTKSHKTFSFQTILTGLTLDQVTGIQNIVLDEAKTINKADEANVHGDYVITNRMVVAGECAASQTTIYTAETVKEAYAFCEALINIGRKVNDLSA